MTGGSAPRNDAPATPLVVLAAGRGSRYGGVKPLAPVGLAGEAVIDVLGSDAIAAGFSPLVLVIGPDTGPAVRYHVARRWPSDVDVRFAVQEAPRGTVDAVLAATDELEPGASFGVANADDLPGVDALALLARHLGGEDPAHAAVCFRLRDSLLGTAPVTRGLCEVGDDGLLRAVDERRHVTPMPDGRIEAHDGREPVELDPTQPVSVNLWGFRPPIHAILRTAMQDASGDAEVLLPDLVDGLLAGRVRAAPETAAPRAGTAPRVRVLFAPGRVIGVTHAEDVALVQAEIARDVGRGERPAQLWATRPAGWPA